MAHQIIQTQAGYELVDQPEWNGYNNANEVSERDPFVSATDGEELMGEPTPSDGLAVVLPAK